MTARIGDWMQTYTGRRFWPLDPRPEEMHIRDIAMALGKELDLPKDDIENLHWAGLLHDVGKIAVDQLIQNKPGKLSHEEYKHIMIHSTIGAGIVKPVVNEGLVLYE